MAQALSKMVGISTTNLRRVADLVRGKSVDEAVVLLNFVPSTAAVAVRKTIESAAANAVNNDLQDRAKLKVVSIFANQGTQIKRFRAKARGRAGAFNRPASHITVIVNGEGAE